jgi:two-component system, OmpR family, KDP operon response regulator KdpE
MDSPCLLVIDDDPKVAHMLDVALGRGGYEIHLSNSGEEALCLAQQRRPDAVLLDLCLPDMSGEDVLTLLKMDRELSDVPVIIATGRTDAPELSEAYAVLFKPLSLKRLFRTLSNALST